ncbi:hypothetical protein BDP81DRAFT_417606 [Colletotrichum phormii]|uniref:Uncharacterized protein n=1 Tax=Colletotrichum phormii TaxID=359342 RepID=A0AAJ0EJC3_9PEZI|nr:uncharacterized protein BDP81DRAFT_417606 [Colletotrichum phormii]KAK1640884.1 hypothetical protein BDP81DRAFT_417606 [Colletotrichum phormii]
MYQPSISVALFSNFVQIVLGSCLSIHHRGRSRVRKKRQSYCSPSPLPPLRRRAYLVDGQSQTRFHQRAFQHRPKSDQGKRTMGSEKGTP